MKAALYVRMSTEEQDDSPEVQIHQATKFIEKKGWTLDPSLIYRDDAKSRAEFKKRTGLLRMVDDAKAKRFDVLVTRDDDRLGGDMYRTGVVLMDLIDSGVRIFYYITDSEACMDDPVAKFVQAAKGFASELERARISQRTRENHYEKAGKAIVSGGTCFGYSNREVPKLDGSRDYVVHDIDDAQAEIVREVFRKFADGVSVRSIVHDLNGRGIPSPHAGKRGTGSWSPSCVWTFLRRERYRGTIVWGKTEKTYRGGTKVRIARPEDEWCRVQKEELRIIPEDLWEAVQARIHQNQRVKRSNGERGPRPKYLLSGLARCSVCGGPMQVHSGRISKQNVKCYMCAYHRERGTCENGLRRPVTAVDEAIVEWLREYVLQEQVVVEVLKEVRQRLTERSKGLVSELDDLEAQAKKLRAEVKRLGEALLSSDRPAAVVMDMIHAREGQLADVEARIVMAQTAPSVIDMETRRMEREARKRLDDLRTLLSSHPTDARRVLEAILDGPLTMTPVRTEGGMRYKVTGQVALGSLTRTESVPRGILAVRYDEPVWLHGLVLPLDCRVA